MELSYKNKSKSLFWVRVILVFDVPAYPSRRRRPNRSRNRVDRIKSSFPIKYVRDLHSIRISCRVHCNFQRNGLIVVTPAVAAKNNNYNALFPRCKWKKKRGLVRPGETENNIVTIRPQTACSFDGPTWLLRRNGATIHLINTFEIRRNTFRKENSYDRCSSLRLSDDGKTKTRWTRGHGVAYTATRIRNSMPRSSIRFSFLSRNSRSRLTK